jgi:cell wall-associated NlpC family hydrolase
VEFLPQGRYGKAHSRGIQASRRSRRAWGRAAIVACAATLASFALPAGPGSAAPRGGTPTSLQAIVAAANRLSNQIDVLGQQFDALRIQLAEARAESKAARMTALRESRALSAGQAAVARIAAQGYMSGGFSPTVELLQSSNPQQLLNRTSIILQLGHQQGGTVSLLAEAEAAANRASRTATQEALLAVKLSAEINKKVAEIQAKENILNSAAYAKALAIFQKTGTYPNIAVRGDSIGAQAVRWALTKVGDPYIWGAAGPNAFDCSGLVMWAYAQVGISLGHFTGFQWNEGEHIARSQLQPGDIVFFFADISHEGMYIGDGLMVDAPTQGVPVHVEPVFWSAYVGAVRII